MALFKNAADLATAYAARLTLDFNDVKFALDAVEHEYMVEQVLGLDQYTQLVNSYTANIMSAEETTLLGYCQRAVAPLMIKHLAMSHSMQQTSAGWVVKRGKETDVASLARIDEMKREQLRLGHRQLDRLVHFLYQNKASYPLWELTPVFNISKGFVTTTGELQKWVPMISGQGYLFMRLRPLIRQAEDGVIRSTVCSDTLYDTLYAASEGGATPGGNNGTLITLIRQAVAHRAMSQAIPLLSLNLDGDTGAYTLEGNSGGDQRSNAVRAAQAERLDRLEDFHEKSAAAALKALTDKLQALAEAGSLPDYLASDCYVDPTVTVTNKLDADDAVGNFL